MNTKLVYTLVGNAGDVYLGQAIISAHTARVNNPTAQIVIVVDEVTGKIINTTPIIRSYFDEVVLVKVPSDLNKIQASRYLKTTLRRQIKGDYLYIDTDTVIVGDLSDCDKIEADIAAVLDRHTIINRHPTLNNVAKDLEVVGLTVEDLHSQYFNSGVMFVRDSELAKQLYERWYIYWDKAKTSGHIIDQPPLAKANKDCGYVIAELPGVWNCQLVDNFINYMNNAKVLHYFSSHKKSPYLLYDEALLNNVAKEGRLGEDLVVALEHPKSLFREKHLLVHDEDVDYNHSYVHDMFSYHRWIFSIFEFVSRFLVTKSFKK